MKFIPDEKEGQFNVPYLESARSDDGWQGQSTNESIESLRSQISAEIGRLGGSVTRFMRGKYEIDGKERPGVQLEYSVVAPNGRSFVGRIDVAGLPWQPSYGGKKSHGGYSDAEKKKRSKSLKMALYNVREALKAMRVLQILSPGYSALIPWMLVGDSEKTIGELWGMGSPALPAPNEDGEIIEADFKEVGERSEEQ